MAYDRDVEFQGAEILSSFKKGLIQHALELFEKYKDTHSLFDVSESSSRR